MIVDCHSCGATYNISDEKVRGRRVRVRCKTCGGAIIVDGEQLVAEDRTRVYQPSRFDPKTEEDEPDAATRVLSLSNPGWRQPGPDDWTVNVTNTDQRTMTLQELVAARNSGLVSDQALVWREGMADWTPMIKVEQIRAALEDGEEATKVFSPASIRGGLPQKPAPSVRPPPAAARPVPSAPTLRSGLTAPSEPAPPLRSEPTVPNVAYSAPSAPPRARLANEPTTSVEYSEPPKVLPRSRPPPAAARIRSGRANADLFAGSNAAGGEEELLKNSSVPLERYEEKPTGARNESSVLFSLNTLKAGAQRGSSAPPRPLASQPTAADILGLDAAGGLPGITANGAMLSAPSFDAPFDAKAASKATTIPPRSRLDTTPPSDKSSRSTVLLVAVAVAAVIMAAVSVQIFRTRFSTPKVTEQPAPSATLAAVAPPPTPAPAPLPSAEPVVPTTPVATSAAAPAPPPPAPPPPAPEPAPRAANPPVTLATTPAPKAPPSTKKSTADLEAALQASRPADPKPAEAPASGPALPKVVLAEEPGADSDDKPAAPSGPAFDTSAAKSALEAAASNAGSCKTDDGPTGRGKVQITFSPDGHASGVNVTDGTFAGTGVGSCVARLFKAAHVPAFNGNPVTVSKSFTIPE